MLMMASYVSKSWRFNKTCSNRKESTSPKNLESEMLLYGSMRS
jgi:hypothetical protein